MLQGSYDDRVRHFDRDGDLHHRFCVVVVHRAKEKAEEKRSAANEDRAIARKPNSKGGLRPANNCLPVKRGEKVVQVSVAHSVKKAISPDAVGYCGTA